MISIGLNKELDIEVYKDFWDFSVAGADFGVRIRRDHPDITIENHREYIEQYYRGQINVLEKNRDELNSALGSVQGKFFEEASNLFGIDFSNETYNGYVSIFDCNPRFIDTNSFQIFHGRDLQEKLGVAFHESLHFMFFKYCDLKLSKETSGLDKNSGRLWDLSEVFNVIVLNLPQFRVLLGKEERLFYPELAEKLEEAKQIWQETRGDVFTLINDYLSSSRTK